MALEIMLEPYENENKSISKLSTQNERGYKVTVGVTRPQSSLVQWILVVEETHSEAFAPVARLQKIILACVFGTAGFIILVVPLVSHWAVASIRRLREAARKSIEPEMSPPLAAHRLQRNEHEEVDRDGNTVQTIERHLHEKGFPRL